MTLELHVVHDPADLEPHRGPWLDLVRRSRTPCPFASPGWLIPWSAYAGSAAALHFVLAYEGPLLRGLAPFVTAPVDGVIALTLAGAGHSDHQTVLVDPEAPAGLIDAMLGEVVRDGVAWDECRLGRLDMEWPESRRLLDACLRSLGRCSVGVCPRPCVPLGGDSDAPSPAMRASTVRRYRYLERRLARDLGAEVRVATAAGDVADAMAALHDARARWWRGCDDVLGSPGEHAEYVRFTTDVAAEMAGEGSSAVLQLVSSSGRLLAAALLLRSEGRLMLWVRGTNPDARRLSPGTVLDLMACRYAVAQRARVLDYGTGDETYKFWCGATDAPVYTFRFAPT